MGDIRNVIVSKLILGLTRNVAMEYLDTDLFAASSGDVLICVGVCLGVEEGRPMTAGKLATFIGMPRSTVIRRLAELRARGVLEIRDGGRWGFALDAGGKSKRSLSMIDANLRLLMLATSELSKLDSQTVASSDPRALNRNHN